MLSRRFQCGDDLIIAELAEPEGRLASHTRVRIVSEAADQCWEAVRIG